MENKLFEDKNEAIEEKEKKRYESPVCETKSPLDHVSATYYYTYYTYTYIW